MKHLRRAVLFGTLNCATTVPIPGFRSTPQAANGVVVLDAAASDTPTLSTVCKSFLLPVKFHLGYLLYDIGVVRSDTPLVAEPPTKLIRCICRWASSSCRW